MLKVKAAFFTFILFCVFSCTKKDNEIAYDIVSDKGELNYQNAFKFLKKNAILNFHLDGNGNLIQDSQDVDSIKLAENIMSAYNHSKSLLQQNIISEYSFINYVLPYKVNLSYDPDWRKAALSHFKWSKTNITDDKSALTACNILNDTIRKILAFSLDNLKEDGLSFDQILQNKKGSCISFTNFVSYVCRANGLPVTTDYIPAWGNINGGHAWNSLVMNKKKSYPFEGSETNGKFEPMYLIKNKTNPKYSTYRTVPKIYRRGFIPDTSSVYIKYFKELAPLGLNFTYTDTDVTDLYTPTTKVDTKSFFKKETNLVILSVFNTGIWIPVAAISPKHNQQVFDKIGVGGLYLISSLDKNNSNKSFCIYINKAGQIKQFNTQKRSVIKLDRDMSIEQEQLVAIAKYGWNDYKKLEKVAEYSKSTLLDKVPYTLYCWNNGWKTMENEVANNRTVSFRNKYEDGIYMILPEKEKINEKKRPFILIEGKVVFI
ncbi:transglutaminase-like domain-containing protein [Chryseobacterium lactis]|nr:transglutaminase domain-containing protein [Chryseobacterium lactis]